MDNDIVILKFADSKVPVFKETRSKDWILFGEDNRYPEYLTYLYNKSAKHAAIVNGKSKYIFGSGFRNEPKEQLPVINKLNETWDDIGKKMAKDVEIYGGYRLFIVYDKLHRILEIRHIEFHKVRTDKDFGYWFKESWDPFNRQEPKWYPEYSENTDAFVSIFAYNEYRPGSGIYPLPEYLACNNYIETDIEISKYYLSSIRNGMLPSKMIQFFGGEPTEEKKKEVERSLTKKFAGAENAGRFIVVFSAGDKSKSVEISDLSATESDKLFKELNLTTQQEIFTGHQVVSPMLFGIKTEGQLGGTQELKTAYDIFINTYAKPKQQDLETAINYLSTRMGDTREYEFHQLDPIGIIIPDSMLEQALTPDEVRERLGLKIIEKPADTASQKTLNSLSSVSPLVATKILDNLTGNEIRSLAGLPPVAGGDVIAATVGLPPAAGAPVVVGADGQESEESKVNENIKNLTGKQYQQLMRIVRQFSQGKITKEAAIALLKSGLGLGETEINALLGIDEHQLGMASDEDKIIQMFDACGDDKRDYHVITNKKVKFSTDEEAAEDEMHFFEQSFASTVSAREADILDLISKDKRITPEVIAATLDTTPEYVTSKIANLVKKGLIETSEQVIGEDVQIERKLTKPLVDILPSEKEPSVAEVFIKYSYEGPEDNKNRPFCAKLLKLNRFYSRSEIEKISQKLGYSVFDRRGGFWRKPDGTISASCRHTWKSNIVVRKGAKRGA